MKYLLKDIRRRMLYGFDFAMKFPTFSAHVNDFLQSSKSYDYVRLGSIALALETIRRDNIEGKFAECGVYKGELSSFIKTCFPERELILFDTFQGFPDKHLEVAADNRFQDTTLQAVQYKLSAWSNITYKVGIFPESAQGLENETFSFVMLDFDLYEPTLAGLEFFYPKLSRGGYCFLHDVNSPESNSACRRAVNQFLQNKPEFVVEIPDQWGSVLFRKM